MDHATALALLDWHIEMGADEAICDEPINRLAVVEDATESEPEPAPAAKVEAAPAQPAPSVKSAAIDVAMTAAAASTSLDSLQQNMAQFDHCDLKRGAKSLVFSDGNPDADVMIIGEAPGRDEDIQGKPFVGRAGQLLDKMLQAIGLSRAAEDASQAVYITNVLPWRPPQNREPTPEETAMLLPFLKRHIELANPKVLVLMGNSSCNALLGRRGITRLRGTWVEAEDRPVLPMFHPAYLLRNPLAKREAWHDLLMLQAKLRAPDGSD